MTATVLEHWGLAHLRDDAELVVSELVTNAVQHAADPSPVIVTLGHEQGWLSIAVTNRSAGLPRAGRATASRENGRGLLLVGLLTESWRCDARGDGTKTVSCRLR